MCSARVEQFWLLQNKINWSILITTTRQTVCQSQQMSKHRNFYLSYSSLLQKDSNNFKVTCSCLRLGCNLCNLYHYKMTWRNMLRHQQQKVFLGLHADFNCWTVGKCRGRILIEHMRKWIPNMVRSGIILFTPVLTIFWVVDVRKNIITKT